MSRTPTPGSGDVTAVLMTRSEVVLSPPEGQTDRKPIRNPSGLPSEGVSGSQATKPKEQAWLARFEVSARGSLVTTSPLQKCAYSERNSSTASASSSPRRSRKATEPTIRIGMSLSLTREGSFIASGFPLQATSGRRPLLGLSLLRNQQTGMGLRGQRPVLARRSTSRLVA